MWWMHLTIFRYVKEMYDVISKEKIAAEVLFSNNNQFACLN